MKNHLLLASALLSLSLGLTACKQDNPSPAEFGTLLTSADWKVHRFDITGRSSDAYLGYVLSFGDSSVVTATRDGDVITGTYTVGFSRDETALTLDFGSITTFENLNADWDVADYSDRKVHLDNDDVAVETDIYNELVLKRE
jgi:hypothetical protein